MDRWQISLNIDINDIGDDINQYLINRGCDPNDWDIWVSTKYNTVSVTSLGYNYGETGYDAFAGDEDMMITGDFTDDEIDYL